jgi:hypothetical protein
MTYTQKDRLTNCISQIVGKVKKEIKPEENYFSEWTPKLGYFGASKWIKGEYYYSCSINCIGN